MSASRLASHRPSVEMTPLLDEIPALSSDRRYLGSRSVLGDNTLPSAPSLKRDLPPSGSGSTVCARGRRCGGPMKEGATHGDRDLLRTGRHVGGEVRRVHQVVAQGRGW